VTPDYGTYGETAPEKLFPRTGRQEYLLFAPTTPALVDVEPVLINPTTSVSGLLENMSSAGGQARALGQMLIGWERMLQDTEMTIVLSLSTPAIAKGLREVLVYAMEHHFVDLVILSADDVFADLYESLGYSEYVSLDGLEDMAPASEGYQATLDCFARFVRDLGDVGCSNSSDLWRRLGTYLPKNAPRKGLLQAAAASGVRLFTPDLGTTALGTALLALRARGLDARLSLDPTQDVKALADVLGSMPRLGVVRSGSGAADALLGQARKVAAAVTETSPLLWASISLGASRPLSPGERHVALAAGGDLIMLMVGTALGQRAPAHLRRPGAGTAASRAQRSRSTTAT
jgi:deoxyhypusine synthase